MSHSDTPVKSKITPAQAGVPQAPPAPATTETLAERYTRMAHEYARPRFADTELRTVDVLMSGFALLILSPLILLTALAIRLTSRGPIFYRGRRVGRRGDIYTMYKFRTLRHGAEGRIGQFYGEALTAQTANEATRLGNMLRFLHLDEIPQLWNVLRGDMSVVGPRPIRPTFFEELCIEIPQYWQRLVVRPGITGFAQLRMTRETSWAEKLAHDLEYIADRSLRLYFRICFATAWKIITLPFRKASRALRGD